ncbi:hypothetical protein TNCV_215831, partial [Trichonephila clavipes]
MKIEEIKNHRAQFTPCRDKDINVDTCILL